MEYSGSDQTLVYYKMAQKQNKKDIICTRRVLVEFVYYSLSLLLSHRYGFSIVGNLVVFSCFWILLGKMNNSVDVEDLSPSDKPVFWVSELGREN